MLNKGGDATFVEESLCALITFIGQFDSHPRIEECQFTNSFGQHIVIKGDIGEGFFTGPELNTGTSDTRIFYIF